jgi:hypothetical protein
MYAYLPSMHLLKNRVALRLCLGSHPDKHVCSYDARHDMICE